MNNLNYNLRDILKNNTDNFMIDFKKLIESENEKEFINNSNYIYSHYIDLIKTDNKSIIKLELTKKIL